MFRSMSRLAVATALVLAFLLSTVPAQAQPRDPGPSLTADASWLELALGWLENLFGSDSGGLQSLETEGKKTDGGGSALRTGPCLDPYGTCGG